MSQPNRTARAAEESGVVQALEARDLSLGEVLGKYRLLGALGHGGMADVYLAVADGPEGFRKLCVLKMLKDSMVADEDFRAMFLDEARLAARLNHPNVVQTFEVSDSEDGRLLLAMEYVEGQPITRVRRRLAPEDFPLTAYLRVLCDVLDALDYAHNLSDFDGSRLGIVHRDVTPHNILIGYDGRVKLVDFGIAKSSAAVQMTQAGVLKGKVGYMAPEQASLADLDGRADVFSVGVILWEAIAGRRLAEGQSARDVLTRRIEGKDPKIAEVVPEVDPELAAICDKAMSKRPADRFASASEMQAELEKWLRKHGEPPRKTWAQALKEAFSPERKQLREIVELRFSDNGMSGMRQSLLGSTGANSAGPQSRSMSASGESSVTARKSNPSPPAVLDAPVVQDVSRPSESVSFPARSVSLDPPAQTRSPVPLVIGVAAAVALAFAVGVYVVKSSSAKTADTQPTVPSQLGAQPPPSESVASQPPPPSGGQGSAVLVPGTPSASASGAATHAGWKPGQYVPPGHVATTPSAHASSTAATPSVPATSPPTTPTTKSSARPLDEKDPYAP